MQAIEMAGFNSHAQVKNAIEKQCDNCRVLFLVILMSGQVHMQLTDD